MNEVPPWIPESISHKKLNKFLSSAKKQPLDSNQTSFQSYEENENFEKVLLEWSKLSKELLTSLNKSEGYLKSKKGAKALLALGAMEAHINMALQALKASENNE